jgi:ATP-dependent Zn protease
MTKLSIRTVVLIVVFIVSRAVAATDSEYLTYPEFISKLDAGLIRSASLDHFSAIHGTYVADGHEKPFHSYADTGSANDVLLTRLLKEKNVPITISEQKERGFFSGAVALPGLLMFGLPLVTLIFVFRINSKLNRLSSQQPRNEPAA